MTAEIFFQDFSLIETSLLKIWTKNIWGDPKKKKDKNDNCILRDPKSLSDGIKSDTPNIFNNFFWAVAPKLQSNITPLSPIEARKLSNEDKHSLDGFHNPYIQNEKFAFRDINTEELKLFIKKIKKNK